MFLMDYQTMHLLCVEWRDRNPPVLTDLHPHAQFINGWKVAESVTIVVHGSVGKLLVMTLGLFHVFNRWLIVWTLI